MDVIADGVNRCAAICGTLVLFLVLLLGGCATSKTSGDAEAQTKATALVRQGLAAKESEGEKKAYLEAIQADPYNALAHNNLGVCLFKERQYYQAAEQFDATMKLAAQAAEPHFNLALLYETVGKLDQAADHYARALELDPQSAKYRVCLARTYMKRDTDRWRARQLLDEALEREVDPTVIAWIRQAQDRLKSSQFDMEPLK
jgi:Tfp pilus assembly protein PilF